MPSPPESVSNMAASAHLAEDAEECTLSFLNGFVSEEAQSANINPRLKDTILVPIDAMHTCLDIGQPVSEFAKVTHLGNSG